MARMYPDADKSRLVFTSSAEQQFYDTARRSLGDGWRVWHSCTLSRLEGDSGLKDNEIDFVVYHPRFGVFVVEVKGGRVRHEGGQFFSINRHGESFRIDNPFQQALVWKSRFLRLIKKQGIKLPVSHAVCFPAVGEEEFPVSAGIEPRLIIGRNRLRELEGTLKAIAQASHPEHFLEFADAGDELDRLLVGAQFTSKLYIRDYIDGHDRRLKDVESINDSLITPIASSERLAVEGEAGTGKTMLAMLLARHFVAQGKKVLLLSSNTLLNLYLKREVGDDVEIATYTETSESFGVNPFTPPEGFDGKVDDWLQYAGPERLGAAIGASNRRYDVLICDEAQDVQPFWWEALEKLLGSAEAARFYLFFDRSQGVFGSDGGAKQFIPEDVLPVPAPYFPLVHNYRTTREIAGFARSFRTGSQILQSHCGRLGYVPELILYKDAEDAKAQLAKLFRRLIREEDLSTHELTLLSARNPDARESVLFQTPDIIRYPLHRLTHDRKATWKDAMAPRGSVAVSTISGFKGLETSVGILLNISEYNLPLDNPIMSSLVYVACTRARHMLYVMVREDDPKRKAFEAALRQVKSTGSVVIEGSSADFEFAGTVTHWNRDRVGFLSVEDQAFQKSSIMFFPSDVARAGITDLKVGTKLIFRPRAEGSTTIACDLRPVLDDSGSDDGKKGTGETSPLRSA